MLERNWWRDVFHTDREEEVHFAALRKLYMPESVLEVQKPIERKLLDRLQGKFWAEGNGNVFCGLDRLRTR